MKPEKALNTKVKKETYCRHGFHDWLEVEETENGADNKKVFKCKRCGKYKE